MRQAPARSTVSEWIATYPAEIMVCDQDGTILEMSNVAIQNYMAEGGIDLIGHNVFDHHKGLAKSQMMAMVNQKRHLLYTTEKKGLKKLVSIAPWYREEKYAGFALIVLDLPAEIPNILKT